MSSQQSSSTASINSTHSCSSINSCSTAEKDVTRCCEPPSTGKERDVKWRRTTWKLISLVRSILLHTPYTIMLVCFTGFHILREWGEMYYEPQLRELNQWTYQRQKSETTYYGRQCTVNDATASSPEDITITSNMTTNDAVNHMLKHGITMFPGLLKEETARELRASIIEHNTVEKNFGVIASENRHSYGILVDQHPVVRQAIHEITTHPVFRPALEQIVGRDPAIYKFHAITSKFGADDQYFHWDVSAHHSSAMFARSFAPLYSLFLPLQNTTAAMGSTEICPGSHVCGGSNAPGFCHRTAFRASGAEDNWPAGYGALMNQQTTHRGRAHTHEGGPDRVLFILAFTPSTQFDHISQLQTRSLSRGGSWATHWSQWGHTVSDLADSWTRMQQPWTMLRALGLYKPKGAGWGWSLLATSNIRMAEEVYPGWEALANYVRDPDGLWSQYVAWFLQGDIPKGEEEQEETGGEAWYLFVKDTLRKHKNCFKKFYIFTLGWLIVPLVWKGFRLLFGLYKSDEKRQNAQLAFWSTRSISILCIHLIVYGLYWGITSHIASTPWARHIRTKKLYQLPSRHRNPTLPSVLPLDQDVLILDDYKSDYLASYVHMYDIAHPGLVAWNTRIDKYAVGYSQLTRGMQHQLCSKLPVWARVEDKSRILTKNTVNQWAEADIPLALDFAHKSLKSAESKMSSDQGILSSMLLHLDFLLAETKFGTWRDTAMHWTHIPAMLSRLQDQMLQGMPSSSTKSAGSTNTVDASRRTSYFRRFLPHPTVKHNLKVTDIGSTSTETMMPDVEEPFPGAWMQVGDEVEARDSVNFNAWYRGTITQAIAHRMQWRIQYATGEWTGSECRECVQRFTKPYAVGEIIEYLAPLTKYNSTTNTTVVKHFWRPVEILAVLPSPTGNDGDVCGGGDCYHFRQVEPRHPGDHEMTAPEPSLFFQVCEYDLRRLQQPTSTTLKGMDHNVTGFCEVNDDVDRPLRLGEDVEARYFLNETDHDEEWHIGRIVEMAESYGVSYADNGEFTGGLLREDLRKVTRRE